MHLWHGPWELGAGLGGIIVPMGIRRLAIDLVGQVCSVGVLASYHESVSDSQRSPALTSTKVGSDSWFLPCLLRQSPTVGSLWLLSSGHLHSPLKAVSSAQPVPQRDPSGQSGVRPRYRGTWLVARWRSVLGLVNALSFFSHSLLHHFTEEASLPFPSLVPSAFSHNTHHPGRFSNLNAFTETIQIPACLC